MFVDAGCFRSGFFRESHNQHDSISHSAVTLYGFNFFWFITHQKVASKMTEIYEAAMRVGEIDSAMYCLCLGMRFSFFGGVNLSILSQSYTKALKKMVGILCTKDQFSLPCIFLFLTSAHVAHVSAEIGEVQQRSIEARHH